MAKARFSAGGSSRAFPLWSATWKCKNQARSCIKSLQSFLLQWIAKKFHNLITMVNKEMYVKNVPEVKTCQYYHDQLNILHLHAFLPIDETDFLIPTDE